jgi:hypothetical protein
LLKHDRKPSPEVQRVIVCHIKQKDLEKQKFKRNKPCKQFRKQKDIDGDNREAIFTYEYVPFTGQKRMRESPDELPVSMALTKRICNDKDSSLDDSPDEINMSSMSEEDQLDCKGQDESDEDFAELLEAKSVEEQKISHLTQSVNKDALSQKSEVSSQK